MDLPVKGRLLDDRILRLREHPHVGGLDGKIPVPGQGGAFLQGQRTCRLHPRRSQAVDLPGNPLRLLQGTVQDEDPPSALPDRQDGHRPGHASGSQDQYVLPLYPHAVLAHGAVEPGHVRIVALEAALCPHQGVHRADGLRKRVYLLQKGYHVPLIGNRHVHSQEV